jgi:hypothetical protein
MHIFNVKSVRDKIVFMESLKYLYIKSQIRFINQPIDSPRFLVRFWINRYHRLLAKKEKYSYPPLIIGHFHVKYMNFKLCDDVQ